jgi:hypothetical protein
MGAEHLNGNKSVFNCVSLLCCSWDDVVMCAWMSMKFWCNDTDKGNGSILRETCPSATFPPHIPHELVRDSIKTFAVRCQWLKPRIVARLVLSFTTMVLEGYILQMFATFQFKNLYQSVYFPNYEIYRPLWNKTIFMVAFHGHWTWASWRNNTKTKWLQKHFNKISEHFSMLRNKERTGHVIITRFFFVVRSLRSVSYDRSIACYQSEFSTECDLAVPLSVSSIFSFLEVIQQLFRLFPRLPAFSFMFSNVF